LQILGGLERCLGVLAVLVGHFHEHPVSRLLVLEARVGLELLVGRCKCLVDRLLGRDWTYRYAERQKCKKDARILSDPTHGRDSVQSTWNLWPFAGVVSQSARRG
jgi:hypothetical protein